MVTRCHSYTLVWGMASVSPKRVEARSETYPPSPPPDGIRAQAQQLSLQTSQGGGPSSQLQQQQQIQQLKQQMGIQIPGATGVTGVTGVSSGSDVGLAQELTQLGHNDVSKLNSAPPGGRDKNTSRGPGSDCKDDASSVSGSVLETALAQMSSVLEEAKEFLKQQKKPVSGEGGMRSMNSEQDEQDLQWISESDFSGLSKNQKKMPPAPASATDKKMLAEFNTFRSALGSRGLPFTLPSYEYLPASSDKQPIPLAVTDIDLKFIVLVLMQETLYVGMLQDWEHSLGGPQSLKLLPEALSLLSMAQDLSQSDLKNILRVKEQGLGEAWKRIWGTLNESMGCTSKNLLSFLHAALRLAVERRYVLSSENREQVTEASQLNQHLGGRSSAVSCSRATTSRSSVQPKSGMAFGQELGGDWAKLRSFLSRTLPSFNAGFTHEHPPELPAGIIKSCIIIARFLGDSGQFREADVLFDHARVLAINGGNKNFCAEVSLYCAELLNKWSASDPAYSVATMARSAEYASQAAMLYDSIETPTDPADKVIHLEKFAQALYWKGLNYSTLCRLGGTDGCSAELACSTARDSLDKCLALRKEIKCSGAKIAAAQFARGVLTFCMAEALSSGHIYKGVHGNGTRTQAAEGLYQKAMELFHEVYEDWRSRLGESALETVKAVTMLSTVANKLDGPAAAIKWSKIEVQIREEVQGTLHPRTQQAKRNHANLLEALAAQNARQRIMGEEPGRESSGVPKIENVDEKKDDPKAKLEGKDSNSSRMNTLLEAVETVGGKRKDEDDEDDEDGKDEEENLRRKKLKKEKGDKDYAKDDGLKDDGVKSDDDSKSAAVVHKDSSADDEDDERRRECRS
jgi:tetratricopeptide (TPR) repeat protein